MTGIRSRTRQLSLSLVGILVLVLLVGPVFVPQELRADAASRIAELAQYFDTTLAGTWQAAFSSRGSDNPASASVSHNGGGSHVGAPPVLMGGDAPPLVAAVERLADTNGILSGSFTAGYGAGSQPNSMAALLGDMLRDGSLGTGGNFSAFDRGSGAGSGPAGSRGDGNLGGASGPAGGGGSASPQRSSSVKSAQRSSGAMDNPRGGGTQRPTDAHQDRVTELGDGFPRAYEQAASGESLNDLFSKNPGTDDWSDRSRNGGGENVVDPKNSNVVGQLLNGLDHPVHGEEHRGSGFQDDVDGGTHSEDGGRHLPEFKNSPDSDGQTDDHGPFDKPPVTDPDRGPVSSVPEPGSLVLLSLGLGIIILWRKLRPAR